MRLKIFIFLILLVYQNSANSKSTDENEFNQKYLSNYFSALVSYRQQNNTLDGLEGWLDVVNDEYFTRTGRVARYQHDPADDLDLNTSGIFLTDATSMKQADEDNNKKKNSSDAPEANLTRKQSLRAKKKKQSPDGPNIEVDGYEIAGGYDDLHDP